MIPPGGRGVTEHTIGPLAHSPAYQGTTASQGPTRQHEPERHPPVSNTSIPRGPGLFALEHSDGTTPRTFITNVRRLAGRDRPPGSVLIASATWLLAILDVGLLYVSFDAQYQYIFAVKNAKVPAMIEAAMLDAGMIILSALGIGLAMRGKASKAERFLIMICSAASAGMNFAAANPGSWRSVAAYTAAPVFLAIITDRVISVIRRHVLPGDTESAWAWLGRATIGAARLAVLIALYLLRTVLAPAETAKGLRQMVLDAAPVPGMTEVTAAPAIGGPDEPDDSGDQADEDDQRGDKDGDERAIEFATKKQAFLSRYRGHPQYGIRDAAARVAAELAPLAGLQAGTGRTYIAEELKRIEATVTQYLTRGNLAIAASEADR
jgi:hypothetical protein